MFVWDLGHGKGRVNFVGSPLNLEHVPFAGGFQKGDRVRSLIDHAPNNVKVGDEGTVVGPSSNPSAADADEHVCVDWGSGKGRVNFVAYPCNLEHVPLAGGFQKGDRVRVLVAHAPNNVKVGDEGTVVGPCSNRNLADADRRVRVDLGSGKGRVNFVADPCNLEHVPLAGGFQKGDRVRSLIDHAPNNVKVGDEGTVVGPSNDPSAGDADEHVCVDLGHGKGRVNFVGSPLNLEHVPLAGGFQKGDRVRSLIDHAPNNVKVGDEGTVVGPSNDPSAADADEHVCVDWGSGKGRVNFFAYPCNLEHVPLAGGFQKGDRVRVLVAHAPNNVKVGDEGTVVGPCSNRNLADEDRRVRVDLGSGKGRVNFVADHFNLVHVPLAGGFQKGDRVRSLIDHAPNNVKVGDEGTVVGPSNDPSAGDADEHVCVDLGHGKGRVNFVGSPLNLEHVPLAGGFQKGDRVRSLIDHAPNNVKVGDEGTVVGPSSNPSAADADEHVCVDWGSGKGRVNFFAYPCNLEHVPLAGGFQKGDRVRVLVAHAPNNVKVGDEGTVVGPCSNRNLADADRRVRVDLGHGQGRVNFVADHFNLEHVPLAGGFQKGDRVRVLVAHAPNNVKVGDEGTVVGPCSNRSLADADRRVLVDLGSGKGRVNFVAYPCNLEHVPLAGGFQKGDRVRSLIDHAPNNVKVGHEGTVVGPSNDPSAADADEHVCVDWGSGKGRVNFVAYPCNLEHVPLAGGFQKGDRVRVLVAHAPNNVKVGDEGTVVGPCSNRNLADADRRVRVDLGHGKGRVNFVADHFNLEHVPLAGGFQKGDRVRSLIDHAPNNVKVGDEGTVVGPSNDPSAADADEHVCVDWGSGKGRVNFVAYPCNLEHVPLAGGFQKGDRVRVLVAHAPNNVKVGDEGTVVGPCSNRNLADEDRRVRVDLGSGKGRVNFVADHFNLEHVPLAGGFQKGDRVRSLIDHAPNNVKVGDEGTVVGPSNDPSAADADEHVCVDWGSGKGRVNFVAYPCNLEHVPLAGGFQKGDRVRVLVAHAPNNVKVGDEGTVVGPCSNRNLADEDRRVRVDLGSGKGRVNFVADHFNLEHVPLAGGFQKGDRVRSLIDHAPNNVKVGDEGTVVGPSNDPSAGDADEHVCVDLGHGKGRVNFVGSPLNLEHVPLAGGFQKGDRVRSLIDHAPNNVKVGDEGTVVGPSSNPSAADADEHVCVDWGSGKGRVNFFAYPCNLEHVSLAGGFQKGDRVRSLIDHAPNNVKVGDEGTVVGPCSNRNLADADRRVRVDLGHGQGRVNFVADHFNLEHVPLAGGFQKGDRVRVLVAHAPNNVKVGDEGTVVGPCSNRSLADADRRVRVDLGSGKGRVNFVAYPCNLEHVPLAGGFQKGDRVRSLIDHAPNNVKVGDEGTVVGPSNDPSAGDADEHVCVDLGHGKGRVNFVGSPLNLEHVPLAGGFQKGDRVRSLIDHAPNNVKVGDEGTVVGPSNDPSAADADEHVCVDWGSGKGRVNFVAYPCNLEHVPLAGGFQKGDRVRVLVAHAPNNVKVGDEGTVVGPCSNRSLADADRRVRVDLGHGKGRVNFVADHFNLEHVPLAGGFQKGDRVRSLIDHAPNNVKVGDEGTVVGPSNDPSAGDADEHVCVDLGHGKGRVNFVGSPLNLEHVPLAGGFQKGDRVRSLIDHAPNNVKVGDEGTVVGPSNDPSAADADEHVCVDWGSGKGRVNFVAYPCNLEHVPLAGGFQKGDRVRSLIDHAPNNVKVGDEGTVVGPSNDPSAGDADEHVCVDWGSGKGRVNFVAYPCNLEHVPLAGGFQKGDRVRSLIDHAPNNVKVGDEGTVVGPNSNPSAADADEHVCVDLGSGKGRVNFVAYPCNLEYVPFAGGFQKGDRVRVLVAHAPNNVKVGDEGTVVGPCSNRNLADADRRVRVDLGHGKGRVNFVADPCNLEHVPLAGGFQKGDRVRSLIDHAPNNVKVGDEGTVVGPSNDPSAGDADEHVCVDWGSGKGRVNLVASSQVEHVPLEGVLAVLQAAPLSLLIGATGSNTLTVVEDVSEQELDQIVAAVAESLTLSQTVLPSLPISSAATRVKRWGDGLESPAAGSRHFYPPGFTVTRDVPEAIEAFGLSSDHISQIMDAGRAMATTASAPLTAKYAAALCAYTEDSRLYPILTFTMRTPHTLLNPTDTELKQYADFIVHTERALSCLPAHVSELPGHGMVYRGIRAILNPTVYAQGKVVTWQGFSSSTRKPLAILEFVDRLPGRKLQGSLFVIESITGKDIRHFSSFPGEEEVLFAPNSQFRVESVIASEADKKAALEQLAAYDMTELDVYVLKQIA
jgi:hypothetical protein